MAVLLGVLVAAAFGSADFLGGRASEKASTPAVLLVAQATAVVGAIAVAALVAADVATEDLVFGAIAGGANVIGLGFLYHGLSSGRMGIVAPVTAVVGAIVPITWGLIDGERPGALVLIGVALAVAAGALISRENDPDAEAEDGRGDSRYALLLAVAGGAALGTSFIFFAKTSPDSGYWPVLSARGAAVVLVGGAVAVLAATGRAVFPQGRARGLALGAGALDVTATALLLLAVRRGLAVVVAPVASLAPAATVVLAWTLLGERVGRIQMVGLALALTGLALIAAG